MNYAIRQLLLLASYNLFVDGLEFINDSKIRKIKDKELENSQTKHLIDDYVAGVFYHPYKGLFVIEYPQYLEDKFPFIENIILTLRLYKEGDVFCKVIWSESGLSHMILPN